MLVNKVTADPHLSSKIPLIKKKNPEENTSVVWLTVIKTTNLCHKTVKTTAPLQFKQCCFELWVV